MKDIVKEQLLANLIWEAETSQDVKEGLLLYLKQEREKLNKCHELLKRILGEDLKAFSDTNNVLPFEYPEWLLEYHNIFNK